VLPFCAKLYDRGLTFSPAGVRCVRRSAAVISVLPLPQFVGDTKLAEGWLLTGKHNYGILDILRHTVLQYWLLAADLLQCQLTTLVVASVVLRRKIKSVSLDRRQTPRCPCPKS
jgi:hypothetical protein